MIIEKGERTRNYSINLLILWSNLSIVKFQPALNVNQPLSTSSCLAVFEKAFELAFIVGLNELNGFSSQKCRTQVSGSASSLLPNSLALWILVGVDHVDRCATVLEGTHKLDGHHELVSTSDDGTTLLSLMKRGQHFLIEGSHGTVSLERTYVGDGKDPHSKHF